jgi:hypothetical protein
MTLFLTEINNMMGSLPTELGILTSLVILDLSYNILLSGSLPFELCDLSNLKRLEVGFTSLTGNLPACFATALPELVELLAPNASLSGPFPDLCEMTKLQWIDIRYNKFTGNLPKCVWPDAKVLYLSDNLFEVRCRCGLVQSMDTTYIFFVFLTNLLSNREPYRRNWPAWPI